MATFQKAMYTGKESILTAYDALNNGHPYFSLWQNQRDPHPLYVYTENDLDKGTGILDNFLTAGEQSGQNDLLYIRIHPALDSKAKGLITNKTPSVATLCVRICGVDPGAVSGVPVPYYPGQPAPSNNNQLIQMMMTKLDDIANDKMSVQQLALEARIKELESREPAEAAEPANMFAQVSGFVGDNPAVIGLLRDLLSPVINKLMGMVQPPVTPTLSVGNVPEPPKMEAVTPVAEMPVDNSDQARFDRAIDTLAKYCDIVGDMELLAGFAEQNEIMFKGFIENLRSTKK